MFILNFLYFLDCKKSGNKLENIESELISKINRLSEGKSADVNERCKKIPLSKKKLTEEEKKCEDKSEKKQNLKAPKKRYAGSFIF